MPKISSVVALFLLVVFKNNFIIHKSKKNVLHLENYITDGLEDMTFRFMLKQLQLFKDYFYPVFIKMCPN